MYDTLDESNFMLFAAKCYDNPQCHDTEEFFDDLKRFKYLKRLFGKFEDTGELKERLILNHLVILYNVFSDDATRMLFYKLEGFHSYLKPFLILLNRLPEVYQDSKGDYVYTSSISMDLSVVNTLRKI